MDVDASFYANNDSCYLEDLFRNDPHRAVKRYGRNFLRFFQGQIELRLTWLYMLADYGSDLADCDRVATPLKAEIEKLITNMQDIYPVFETPGISVFYAKRLVLAVYSGSATKNS
ncbi:hypothetical protein BGAL_0359g00090 [Botrytis galanthina]|uniref:Uncharacterized protein n=1 Tax=Botrytis galanthina TaxID=278940 RepID=A0A4V4HTT7_9HELO|nr:hypothetical protein BGAL_0359g00090 [Botrytis galanthina]